MLKNNFKNILKKIISKIIHLNQKTCCKSLLVLLLTIIYGPIFGQKTLPLSSIIDSSLLNNPSLNEASSMVEQQQHLLKAAVNLPPPEVLLQNPTGSFYTFGVQQVFEFPTVYKQQKQLQREHIKLAQTAKKLTEADIKYQISIRYIELQYQLQSLKLIKQQDSIYTKMTEIAQNAFNAGIIDFNQINYTKMQAGLVKANLLLATSEFESIMENLKILCGIKINFLPEELIYPQGENLINFNENSIAQNQKLIYSKQEIAISEKKLNLEKNKVLPGFTMAYLNQSNRNTPFENRFYAGFRIPIWFWQYKANINAAKSQLEATKYNSQATTIQVSSELKMAYNKFFAYQSTLSFYNTEILQDSKNYLAVSDRFFKAGNTSYIEYLRSLSEAANIQKNYLETLKNYKQTSIYIHYLCGIL